MAPRKPLGSKRENTLAPICRKLTSLGYVPGFFADGKDRPGKGWPTRALKLTDGGATLCIRMRDNQDLACLDIDITDELLAKTALELIYDKLPSLRRAPVRHSGGVKVMLFVRCHTEGKQLKSRGWQKEEGEPQRIEFFTSNDVRYVATHGKHSEGREYGWRDGVGLEDVAFTDLPEVTYDEVAGVLMEFDKAAEGLGYEKKAESLKGKGDPIYDLLPEMEIKLDDGTVMTLADLEALAPGMGKWQRAYATPWDPASDRKDRVKYNVGPLGLELWDTKDEVMHYWASEKPPDLDLLAGLIREHLLKPDQGTPATEIPERPPHTAFFSAKVEWLLQTHGYSGPDHKVIELYLAEEQCKLEPAAFKMLFAPWHIESPPGRRGGKPQITWATEEWEKHPDRISVRGARLRPDKPFPIYEDDSGKYKNTYRRPVHEGTGDITVWRRFIEHLLPDPIEREWFLNWLAHKWRNPGVPGVAVIMVACDGNGPVYGAGRGFLRDIVARLIGRKYVEPIDFDVLTGASSQGQFTAWGAYALMVTVSESKDTPEAGRWADRRATYERLKELVEPRAVERTFQVKKEKAFRGIAFASYLIFSNNRDSLQIPAGDRRFAALANGTKMTPEMARELTAWMEDAGNIASLARELEGRDLSEFDVYTPLDTETKTTMQELAVSELDEWFAATRKVITNKMPFTAGDALEVMLKEVGSNASDDLHRTIKRRIRNESRGIGGDWRMDRTHGRARILVWRDYAGEKFTEVERAQEIVLALRKARDAVAKAKNYAEEKTKAQAMADLLKPVQEAGQRPSKVIKLRPGQKVKPSLRDVTPRGAPKTE
jgi:hypothetical protein